MSIQTTKFSEAKSATISTTAKAISHADFSWTAGVLAAADKAVISARTGGVMYRYDNADPSVTVGHLIAANGSVTIVGNLNIQALRFIREAGTDATLTITIETD